MDFFLILARQSASLVGLGDSYRCIPMPSMRLEYLEPHQAQEIMIYERRIEYA